MNISGLIEAFMDFWSNEVDSVQEVVNVVC